MSSDGVLTGLNENTKALYLNMLKNSGVINAQEVVTNRLALAEVKLAAESEDVTKVFNGTNTTSKQVQDSLNALAKKYGTTTEALGYFIVQNKIANATTLNTYASREELRLLLISLGVTADAISAYNTDMEIAANARKHALTAKLRKVGELPQTILKKRLKKELKKH